MSPLHQEFHSPLPHTRPIVSIAGSRLSRDILRPTYRPTYTPFTPSDSGQRSPPPYYRGCWHGVSRGLFYRYRHVSFVPVKKGFTSRRTSSPTRRRWFRVSPIDQNSLLLPPVGVGAVSQSPCGRSLSQAGYPSKPWWAITPPTS